eukprot:scaffold1364_cov75-Skeletonema_dohrnii-CCMP3373.AAC.1
MVIEFCSRPCQIGPHQVNYEAAATPLQAVDCTIDSVKYDMVLEYCSPPWPCQIGPHQVTYDVAAWPIHR